MANKNRGDSPLQELIYRPLRRDNQEIRLLEIQPAADQNDPLRCTLRHKKLHSAEYDAISYVWGDQINNRSHADITYHSGKKFTSALRGTFSSCFAPDERQGQGDQSYRNSIGSSLGAALKHLRQKSRPITVWTDALCINQSDDEEKSWQVRLMTQIYSNAKVVHAWLGPRVGEKPEVIDAVNAAFDSVNLVAQHLDNINYELLTSPERLWLATCFELAQPWSGNIPQPGKGHSAWALKLRTRLMSEDSWGQNLSALIALSRNDYFSRIWILQESGKAHNSTFHYAGRKAAYRPLFLSLCLAQGFCTSNSPLIPRTLSADFDARFLSCLTARMESDLNGILQMTYFSRSRMHQATDPRDLIFGLLGLTSGNVEIKVDYSLSVEQVYVKTAQMLLRQGFTQLLVAFKPYASNQDLPSWAYDWTTKGSSSFERCKACGDKKQQLSFVRFPDLRFGVAMTLEGIKIGRVTVAGTKFSSLARDSGFQQGAIWSGNARNGLLPLSTREKEILASKIIDEKQKLGVTVAYEDIMQALDDTSFPLPSFLLWWLKWIPALWTLAKNNTSGGAAEALQELLLRAANSTDRDGRTLLRYLAAATTLQDLIDLRHFTRASASTGGAISSTGSNAQPAILPDTKAIELLFQSAWGMRQIALDTGLVGYAPEAAQPGDELVIFYDIKAPLVVRNAGDNAYRIIGPAHVAGVMQGQFMRADRPSQTYVLV